MISVDTNVIVRLLTGDNQPQFQRAKSLFEKESIFITTTVILETECVLRYTYHFEPLKIADAFQSLFGLSNVQIEEPLIIADAIEWHKKDLDFVDALHLAKSQTFQSFATFDKKLIKKALKLTNTPVLEP
jgi:predicted nucleic-acid-binding protein